MRKGLRTGSSLWKIPYFKVATVTCGGFYALHTEESRGTFFVLLEYAVQKVVNLNKVLETTFWAANKVLMFLIHGTQAITCDVKGYSNDFVMRGSLHTLHF